jgi:hypothetical protein
VYTLGRGAIHGAGFGLAVAGVETWLVAYRLVPPPTTPAAWALIVTAGRTVGLGIVLGAACATLLRLRNGFFWHRLGTAVAWAVVAIATAPGAPSHGVLAGVGGALVLVPVARGLAFKWRWDPVLLGLAVIAAGIATAVVRG